MTILGKFSTMGGDPRNIINGTDVCVLPNVSIVPDDESCDIRFATIIMDKGKQVFHIFSEKEVIVESNKQ